jgi:hypothetical protein
LFFIKNKISGFLIFLKQKTKKEKKMSQNLTGNLNAGKTTLPKKQESQNFNHVANTSNVPWTPIQRAPGPSGWSKKTYG